MLDSDVWLFTTFIWTIFDSVAFAVMLSILSCAVIVVFIGNSLYIYTVFVRVFPDVSFAFIAYIPSSVNVYSTVTVELGVIFISVPCVSKSICSSFVDFFAIFILSTFSSPSVATIVTFNGLASDFVTVIVGKSWPLIVILFTYSSPSEFFTYIVYVP